MNCGGSASLAGTFASAQSMDKVANGKSGIMWYGIYVIC